MDEADPLLRHPRHRDPYFVARLALRSASDNCEHTDDAELQTALVVQAAVRSAGGTGGATEWKEDEIEVRFQAPDRQVADQVHQALDALKEWRVLSIQHLSGIPYRSEATRRRAQTSSGAVLARRLDAGVMSRSRYVADGGIAWQRGDALYALRTAPSLGLAVTWIRMFAVHSGAALRSIERSSLLGDIYFLLPLADGTYDVSEWRGTQRLPEESWRAYCLRAAEAASRYLDTAASLEAKVVPEIRGRLWYNLSFASEGEASMGARLAALGLEDDAE